MLALAVLCVKREAVKALCFERCAPPPLRPARPLPRSRPSSSTRARPSAQGRGPLRRRVPRVARGAGGRGPRARRLRAAAAHAHG